MPAPTLPAQFSLSNDNGVVTVGGAVHDEATRTSIMDYLRSIFGAGNVKGDITVDPARKPGSWLGRMRDALEAMKIPGLKAMFDGDKITLNGLPNAGARDRLLDVLKGLFGSGMSFTGNIADKFSDLVSGSQTKTLSALGSLQSGFSPQDLLNILNMAIINFATSSFEIPDSAEPILKQAATRLKELPAGTKVEIAGYTDNTGDSNMNVELSNQRASAVRDYLIKAGIDAGMLSAKGYGAASPVAANDTAEGRFQNRRIEYHLAP